MTAQAIGTKIYIFGGRESASSSSVFSYFIFRFDTETNEFYGDDYETTLPVFIADMASAVVGNKIYLFGGYEKGVGASNIIMEYDPETHKVRTLSSTLPEKLYGSACAVYGNEVFLFGGVTSNHQGYSTYIIRFDPNTEQAEKVSTPTLNVAIGYAVAAEAGNCIYIFGGKRNSSNSHVLYYYKYGYEIPSGLLLMLVGNGRGFEVFKNDGNITMYLNVYKCYKGNQDNVGEKIPFATYQSGAWSEYK
jgi:N-acetylneuraminic acid mutarotase